jgi:hypothetical protein
MHSAGFPVHLLGWFLSPLEREREKVLRGGNSFKVEKQMHLAIKAVLSHMQQGNRSGVVRVD